MVAPFRHLRPTYGMDLITLDLAHGRIVRDVPIPEPIQTHGYWFQRDARCFLGIDDELAVLDPTSGEITAAVRLRGVRRGIEPKHIVDGKLWIYKPLTLLPLDEQPLALLRADTLDPIAVHSRKAISFRDIRVAAQQWFTPTAQPDPLSNTR